MPELNIKEMSYRRIINLGNYETASLEVKISLDEKEDPDETFETLKGFVENKLYNGD